jgi:hypothetical protein
VETEWADWNDLRDMLDLRVFVRTMGSTGSSLIALMLGETLTKCASLPFGA